MEKFLTIKHLSIALIILILGLQASHKADAVQTAQTMLLIKRQTRDERGYLIDLNKEPVPEPVSSGGIVEEHRSTSIDLAELNPSSMQNVRPKLERIPLPVSVNRLIKTVNEFLDFNFLIKPGLSEQEKEVYRNKVKIERQRERRKM